MEIYTEFTLRSNTSCHITDYHAGNPCVHKLDQTAKIKAPMIGKWMAMIRRGMGSTQGARRAVDKPFELFYLCLAKVPLHIPVVTMDDTRTMAQLLEAPTVGYEDAIVVPEITADNFELKHDHFYDEVPERPEYGPDLA
ncbi:hypothetical protein Tco_0298513 [Tanacetum coccineum]